MTPHRSANLNHLKRLSSIRSGSTPMSEHVNVSKGLSVRLAMHSIPSKHAYKRQIHVAYHLPAVYVLPTPGFPCRRKLKLSPLPWMKSADQDVSTFFELIILWTVESLVYISSSAAMSPMFALFSKYVVVRSLISVLVPSLRTRRWNKVLSKWGSWNPAMCNFSRHC